MLKPQELKIGNYVNALGEDRQILGISKHNGQNETERYYVEFKDVIPLKIIHIKPIPLNEQWLIDFGFQLWDDDVEQNRQVFVYKIDNTEYRFILNEWLDETKPMCGALGIYSEEFIDKDLDVEEEEITQYFSWSIKYVHQIQSIVQALTGQELTIKTEV